MNFQPAFPEFEPEFNPIGYALAVELRGKTDADAIADGRLADSEEIDRFGWEYDSAA